MFKTIIKFNSDSDEKLNFKATVVEMFLEKNLTLAYEKNEIIITDTETKNAFSDYWAVFFKLKKMKMVNREVIEKFSWEHDGVSENLLTDFFKV